MAPLSIVSLLACTAIVVSYVVRVIRSGRARHERLGARPGSALLPGFVVEAFYWALQVPGRALARLGVAPDVLTVLALVCSLVSLPLIATGRLAEGAIAVAVGGALDALDGLVARLQGSASPAGAVLDQVLDRVADSAPYAGLAVLWRGSAAAMLVPIAAMVASSLVSYARARADALGLVLPSGTMRRHERIAYLMFSLLIGPIMSGGTAALPYPATLAGVGFIAVASAIAAIVLVDRIRTAVSRPAPGQPSADACRKLAR